MPLMGFELVREMVASVILTGRLKQHRPVSLLLIAEPERGKTSIVLERQCKSLAAFSDVTGRGLQEICKYRPEVSHIILSDLTTVTAHRPTVSKLTIATLNAMTEEGILAVSYPGGVETFPHGKRGIIACLTTSLLSDGRAWWQKIGFASRMLPFAFDHGEEMRIIIRNAINKGHGADFGKELLELRVPDGQIFVTFNVMATRVIAALAARKAKEFGEIGYRRLKQFRALAAGHALLRTWKSPMITKQDIAFLKEVDPYISYEETKLL